MEQYYDRVKLRRLSRECATQAQTIGVILVGEASFLFFSVFILHMNVDCSVIYIMEPGSRLGGIWKKKYGLRKRANEQRKSRLGNIGMLELAMC